LPIRALLLILEFSCIALAFTLVYLFTKIYNTKRSILLLGLPLGFFFLLCSYLFLGAHLVTLTFQPVDSFSSSLMWLRVITQTTGLVLITSSYMFASRYQNTGKHSLLTISLGSTALIISVFVLLFFINPSGLPLVYTDIDYFAIANLVLLTYILIFLIRKLFLEQHGVSTLIGGVVAFACLWIGQVSFLVWALANGGDIPLYGSQIARIVSFSIFLLIFYETGKEASHNAIGQKK
jgi:hypothetical protein